MPELLLDGPEVYLPGIEFNPIGMPEGMGGFPGLIELQGLEVFLDNLLDGLAGPCPPLADEEEEISLSLFRSKRWARCCR